MKKAVIFLVNEYADWESAFIAPILNESPEWEVVTSAVEKEVTSIGGFRTKVDCLLEDLSDDLDLFVLIGGNAWSDDNVLLCDKLSKMLMNHTRIGAICGAVDFLARNGLLSGYKHTGNLQQLWSDYQMYDNPEDFMEEQAVRDRNLVTANGTAPIEFEELLLELVNFASSEDIKKTVLLQKIGFYEYCQKFGNPYY